MKEIGDVAMADAAAQSARMSATVKATIKTGAVACLKKRQASMENAPEITLVVGLTMWAGGNFLAMKKLKETGQRLRATPPPAPAPASAL
jgi:hypothetical protein